MRRQIFGFAFALATAILYGTTAYAGPTHDPYPAPAPIYQAEDVFPASMDALCHGGVCGTMTINQYGGPFFFFDDPDHPADATGAGITISGTYANTSGLETRYIQTIIKVKRGGVNPDEMYLKSPDGSSMAPPIVDTPPGGYQGQPFDYEPYYDEAGDFPDFFDAPRVSLTRLQAETPITVEFETWIVCVIAEDKDLIDNTAKGDTYDVAPLLGFDWGFTATFDPNEGPNGTFHVDPLDFYWITGTPSAQWFAALGQTYNTGEDEDWFNVNVGDCDTCRLLPVPEPAQSGLALAMLGLIGLIFVTNRRRFGV